MRYGARDARLDRAELRRYARLAGITDDHIVEPYSVIAEVLGKSGPACRQLVSRARRKMHSARPDGGAPGPAPASAELLLQLMDSVLAGDEERP
jgi:hypothetical protein